MIPRQLSRASSISTVSSNNVLQAFFEAHEADAAALQHDRALSANPQHSRHLRHLPEYIKDKIGGDKASTGRRGNAARGLKRKLRPSDDPLNVRPCIVLPGIASPCHTQAWSIVISASSNQRWRCRVRQTSAMRLSR